MMQKSGKVVVVSQHYPPDPSTTAAIMAAISERVAREAEVLVLSGTAGSAAKAAAGKPASRRSRELDARQGRIAQARFGRTAVHDPDVRSAVGEIAPRRRRAHRARTLHAALRFCRRRQIERREVGADHARSLSRRPHHGRPAEAAFVAGESDARPERADVSRARRRRHHRPRHRKAAAALWRNDKRQDPFHSELGDACARRSRGRS